MPLDNTTDLPVIDFGAPSAPPPPVASPTMPPPDLPVIDFGAQPAAPATPAPSSTASSGLPVIAFGTPAPASESQGFLSSLWSGVADSASASGRTLSGNAFTDQPVQPEPDRTFMGKVGYGIGSSAPGMAAGLAGAAAGTAIEPGFGTAIGGAAGFGAAGLVQTLAPAYQAARAQGLDHDAAVEQAVKQGVASGAIGALTAPLLAWAPFKSVISNILLQSAGQTVIGAGQQGADAAITGQVPTAKDVGSNALVNLVVGLITGGTFHGVPAVLGLHGAPAEGASAEGAPAAEGAPPAEGTPPVPAPAETPAPSGVVEPSTPPSETPPAAVPVEPPAEPAVPAVSDTNAPAPAPVAPADLPVIDFGATAPDVQTPPPAPSAEPPAPEATATPAPGPSNEPPALPGAPAADLTPPPESPPSTAPTETPLPLPGLSAPEAPVAPESAPADSAAPESAPALPLQTLPAQSAPPESPPPVPAQSLDRASTAPPSAEPLERPPLPPETPTPGDQPTTQIQTPEAPTTSTQTPTTKGVNDGAIAPDGARVSAEPTQLATRNVIPGLRDSPADVERVGTGVPDSARTGVPESTDSATVGPEAAGNVPAPGTERGAVDLGNVAELPQLTRLRAREADLAARPATPETTDALAQTRDQIARLERSRPPAPAPTDEAGFRQGVQAVAEARRGGKPPAAEQTEFERAQLAPGPSAYHQAFADAGLDPVRMVNRPIAEQNKALTGVVQQKFGFKNIEISPGADTFTTRNHLLNFYRNGQNMASAMRLPHEAMSLYGRLSLRIDREGKPYYGSYDRAKSTISQTGSAQSFAHEWTHAVDHYLADDLMRSPDREKLMTWGARNGVLEQKSGVQGAFARVINEMFYDDQALMGRRLQLESTVARGGEAGREAQAQLDKLDTGASRLRIKPSEFRGVAETMPNPSYWASAHELLARAHEAYIADRMHIDGSDTTGVAMKDEAYRNTTDRRLEATYPKADERARIFSAFDDLHHALRNENTLDVGREAGAPSTDPGLPTPSSWGRVEQKRGTLLQAVARDAGNLSDMLHGRRVGTGEARGSFKEFVYDPSRPGSNNPTMGEKVRDNFRAFTYSHSGNFDALIGKYKDRAPGVVEPLRKLRDLVSTDPGSGRYISQVYEEEVKQRAGELHYQLQKALLEHAPRNRFGRALPLTDEHESMWRHMLVSGEPVMDGKPIPDWVQQLSYKSRQIMDAEYQRNLDAGLDLGYARNGYFTRIFDTPKIASDMPGFQRDATRMFEFLNEGRADDEKMTPEQIAADAADLTHRFLRGEANDFDTRGPSAKYTKGRKFPPEADTIMRDWLLQKPSEVLPMYFDASARRTAYVSRFGDAAYGNDKITPLLDQMLDAGMHGDDVSQIKKSIEQVTGRVQDHNPRGVVRVVNGINAFGTMMMMPHTAWNSFAEPFSAALGTGDFKLAFDAWKYMLGATIRTASSRERAQIAQVISINSSRAMDSVMMSRSAEYKDSPNLQRILSGYFDLTGLTKLTQWQRNGMTGAGTDMLKRLTALATSEPTTRRGRNQRDDAAAMLREFGADDPDHAPLKEWLKGFNNMPSEEAVNSHPMGKLYSQMLLRLVNRTNQDPMKVDKPMRAAADPVSRLGFALMSFNYSFQKNVLNPAAERVIHNFKRGYEQGGGGVKGGLVGAYDGVRALGNVAGAAGLMVGTALTVGSLHTLLYNPDVWDQHEEKGDLLPWLIERAVSQAGLGGTIDPLSQLVTATRYDQDIGKLLLGAPVGYLAQNLNDLVKPASASGQGAAAGTNTELYKQTRAAENFVPIPLGLLALTYLSSRLPGGPLAGAATLAAWQMTSPRFLNAATDAMVGPRGVKREDDAPDTTPVGNEATLFDPLFPKEGDGRAADPEEGGGGVISKVGAGLLDDVVAPLSGMAAMLPGWLKAGVGAGVGLYAVKNWWDRGEPFRDQPAPEKKP